MKYIALLFIALNLHANDLLTDYKNLVDQVNGNYSANWEINNKETLIVQNLKVNSCELTLKTYINDKLIQRDIYNLTKVIPRRLKSISQKNPSISFGLKSFLKRRSRLFFNNETKRDETHFILKDLHYLCKNEALLDLLRTGEKEDYSPPLFDGKIPLGREETSGEIQDKKGNLWVAPMKGATSYIQRIKLIRDTKNSLSYQTLDFHGDPFGIYVGQELIKARERGVEVKVLVDGLANSLPTTTKTILKNTSILYNNLMASGIRVFGYSCKGGSLKNELRGFDFDKLLRRNHEKLIISDPARSQRKAIVGGINTSYKYFETTKDGVDNWRDYDVLIEGNIVEDVYQGFKRNFNERSIRFKDYDDDKACLNPYNPIKEKKQFIQFKNKSWKNYVQAKKGNSVILEDTLNKALKDFHKGYYINPFTKLREKIPSPRWELIERARFVISRPDENENYIRDSYVDLIRSAQKNIYISNQFFIPDGPIKDALREAASRGVRINIITNSSESKKDAEMITIVGRWHYLDIVFSRHIENPGRYGYDWNPENVKIYEYTGLKDNNSPRAKDWLHAKIMTVDDEVTLIGSFNMDYSSQRNSESIIILESRQITGQFNQWIKQDIEYSNRISYDEMFIFRNPPVGKYRIKLKFGQKIEHYL